MNQPHCAFDEMPTDIDDLTFRIALRAAQQFVNAAEPPICEHCARLIGHCDDDTHGCGTTPAKEETWRDRPPLA